MTARVVGALRALSGAEAKPGLRRNFELVALHLGEVSAFDPDQAGVAVAPRRVQIALVVEVRDSGRQLVGADLLDLARPAVDGLLEQ
jgi:hypothetical protein